MELLRTHFVPVHLLGKVTSQLLRDDSDTKGKRGIMTFRRDPITYVRILSSYLLDLTGYEMD